MVLQCCSSSGNLALALASLHLKHMSMLTGAPASATDHVPFGQSSQNTRPSSSWYVPGGHLAAGIVEGGRRRV